MTKKLMPSRKPTTGSFLTRIWSSFLSQMAFLAIPPPHPSCLENGEKLKALRELGGHRMG